MLYQKAHASGTPLIVITGGFALCIEQTGPVLRLKSLLQVTVNENFDRLSLSSDRKCGNFLRRSEVAKNEGSENRGERAPVTNDVTFEFHALHKARGILNA